MLKVFIAVYSLLNGQLLMLESEEVFYSTRACENARPVIIENVIRAFVRDPTTTVASVCYDYIPSSSA